MQNMKTLILVLMTTALLSGCARHDTEPLFSGRVECFYSLDEHDCVAGFTRFDKGLPNTITRVKEDVFVEVHKEWVIVKLLNRKDTAYVVPRERVRAIIVGTKEGNELNIPK
jgi:hypothetical protein